VAEGPGTAELLEELRKAKVSDLLVHTCSMVASLGFAKLDPGGRDLDQARLAIESLRALEPLLPEEARRDVTGAVASLQLAYADAVNDSR
jgi:hypothetical protein